MNSTSKESIELLEKMGVGINAQNLVYYSQEGGINEVQHLLNAGIHPDSKSEEGLIPLNMALKNSHSQIVDLLIEKGAGKDIMDGNGSYPLYIAVYNNKIEFVKQLLTEGANVNGPKEASYSPLHLAMYKDNIELVKLLIENGADIDCIDTDGNRPIRLAFQEGNQEIVDFLLKKGAEPLTEEEKKKESFWRNIGKTLKDVYSLKSYIFLSVNLFCLIIIFFVLDEKTGGGFFMRLFAFLFCTIIGGFLGMYWSVKRKGDIVQWFKYGAGILLLIFTLIAWSNKGYTPSYSGRSSNSTGGTSTGSHSCGYCGKSFSGNGWSTVGGEQYKQTSWSGYGYCSKSCAYDSQPKRWKY